MAPPALLKRSLLFLAGGVIVEVVGSIGLSTGIMPIAKVLLIYPSALPFYVIPESVTDRLSEATVVYIGMIFPSVLWATTLWFGWAAVRRMRPRG